MKIPTKTLYVYHASAVSFATDVINSEFVHLVKRVEMEEYNDGKEEKFENIFVSLIYHCDDNLLYPVNANIIIEEPFSIEKFKNEVLCKNHVQVYIETTKKRNLREKSKEEYPDFPRIITILKNRKMIETTRNNNALATDNRKFRIIGDVDYYNVDCLGTAHFTEMSGRILNLIEGI